jgi:hypothetical protein
MEKTTLVKFMTREELVSMLVQIKNFKNPDTGKYHHAFKTCEQHWADRWNCARYRFNMKNLDYVDALVYDDGGYVRYTGCAYEPLMMLKHEFGFREE